METLLLIGAIVVLVLLARRGPDAGEVLEHIVVVRAQPQASGCQPAAMFVLGAVVMALLVGGFLLIS